MRVLDSEQSREAQVILIKLNFAVVVNPPGKCRETQAQQSELALQNAIRIMKRLPNITAVEVGIPEELFQRMMAVRV